MAISVVGVGAVDSATPWAPSIAGPVLADDIILILVEQASLTTPEAAPAATGFAHVLGSPVGPDSAGTVLSVLWKRAVGGETSATVTGPSNHAVTRTITLRGVKATGNPWNVNPAVVGEAPRRPPGGGVPPAAATPATWPAVTPTVVDCLVCLCIATGRDNNSTANLGAVTNANLTSLTERVDNWVATGTGGGIGLVTGFKAAATTTGTSTATMGTTDGKALMTLPLEPAAGTTHQAAGTATTTSTAGGVVTATGAVAGDAVTTSTASGALTIPSSRTPPTYPAEHVLAEGTGTRQFNGGAGIATQAGDHLVVEAIGEDGGTLTAMTPTATGGLTFTQQNNVGGSGDVRVQQWTAPDAAGGSRVVTITPNDGAARYRAHLTVDRGSDGPGTGKAVSATGQTVSVARQDDNSGMHMAVGDWSAGAVGTPTWTPGGATRASQQGAGATYLFGRWDDAGTAATESHGISSPSYTTPSIAVLEMLGTAGGPVTHQIAGAATTTSTAAAAVTAQQAATGTATTTSTAAADLTRVTPIAGAGSTVSSATAAVTAQLQAAGTATTVSSASGALTRVTPLSGAATTTASSSAALTITSGAITWDAAGTAVTTSTAAGAVTAVGAVAATAVTTSSAAAVLAVIPGPVEGGTTTTSTATATLALQAAIAGTPATTTSSASAALTVVGAYTPAYIGVDSHTVAAGTLDSHTIATGHLD